MSFVTKRERVFNEYETYDLPARNEGKLKAYASCTDARAWSHFCSDKSEHLVELIKRNNDLCAPKYVPTEVIVNTLLMAKKMEIARLKQKIDTLEQIMEAYEGLDLDCDQRCDIAAAIDQIKAANKELDDMCIDLDLSGFSEAMTEDYMTGKSTGDAAYKVPVSATAMTNAYKDGELQPKASVTAIEAAATTESKGVQNDDFSTCHCESKGTNVNDPRIGDMQDKIIQKDAKLNAMRNTIASMESDVCEPYCIYAHIYTALEKIFGILYQNDKYKRYLDLLAAGKDTRCIDIKGKILFKMKVLEKFCLALVAPCSQTQEDSKVTAADCPCYRAEVMSIADTSFALTPEEAPPLHLDSKRAQLIADIMENEDIKDILSHESNEKLGNVEQCTNIEDIEDYNIDNENLKRLKELQASYEDLMTCYENLKYERDLLQIRCAKYNDLELELETLRTQLLSYNQLWNEKEHFRKRSEELDALKEKFTVLYDEASSLETALKAENEINKRKSKTIEDLRRESIDLDTKLNNVSLSFEKEKNALQYKLQEAESKIVNQEQHIQRLSVQMEQSHEKFQSFSGAPHSINLINEIETWKEEANSLKKILDCCEEEKQQFQQQFQEKLSLINDLRMEIEDWKSTCDQALNRNMMLMDRNNYLEKIADELKDDLDSMQNENKGLKDNLDSKSLEVSKLLDEIEKKKIENNDLLDQLDRLRSAYSNNLASLEDEKKDVTDMLLLEKQHSEELIRKIQNIDDTIQKQEHETRFLQEKVQDLEQLEDTLNRIKDENEHLKQNIASLENANIILMDEIRGLREANAAAANDIDSVKETSSYYENSFKAAKKESEKLQNKIAEFGNMSQDLEVLKEAYNNLLREKHDLKRQLEEKHADLEQTINSIQLSQRESQELLKSKDNLQVEIDVIHESYKKAIGEKTALQTQLADKNKEIEDILKALDEAKMENIDLLAAVNQVPSLQQKLNDLEQAYKDILAQYKELQNIQNDKNNAISALENKLTDKSKEINILHNRLGSSESQRHSSEEDLKSLLQDVNRYEKSLEDKDKEIKELTDKLQKFLEMERELKSLSETNAHMKLENNQLLKEKVDLENRNQDLNDKLKTLIEHNEHLENNLIKIREQKLEGSTSASDGEYDNLRKLVAEINQEKVACQTKNRSLLDQLDEKDNVIANLSHDLLARDDKIAIMQNHINELEAELRQLHQDLDLGLTSGEEILSNGYRSIEESLKRVDAHHSKANHNMKAELVKMKKENEKLTNAISASNERSHKLAQNEQNYAAEIAALQNERENLMDAVRDLEIKATGDSPLSRNNCEEEDIIASINRISQEWDKKNSKNSSLENSLLKVQTSSQLLLVKAEEAKKLAEKEKQKNISEKEETLREKIKLEKQIADLKARLERQNVDDQSKIKDLEAEILNQKLLSNTQHDYISQIENEIKQLERMYKDALSKTKDLEDKLLNTKNENQNLSALLEKTTQNLKAKTNEVASLLQLVDEIKDQSKQHIQPEPISKSKLRSETKNDFTQTSTRGSSTLSSSLKNQTPNVNTGNNKFTEHTRDYAPNEKNLNKKNVNPLQLPELKELQVMTAKVEPPADFIKNNYQQNKIRQLSQGPMEHHSIESKGSDEKEEIGSSVNLQKKTNTKPQNNIQSLTKKGDSKTKEILNTIQDPEEANKNVPKQFSKANKNHFADKNESQNLTHLDEAAKELPAGIVGDKNKSSKSPRKDQTHKQFLTGAVANKNESRNFPRSAKTEKELSGAVAVKSHSLLHSDKTQKQFSAGAVNKASTASLINDHDKNKVSKSSTGSNLRDSKSDLLVIFRDSEETAKNQPTKYFDNDTGTDGTSNKNFSQRKPDLKTPRDQKKRMDGQYDDLRIKFQPKEMSKNSRNMEDSRTSGTSKKFSDRSSDTQIAEKLHSKTNSSSLPSISNSNTGYLIYSSQGELISDDGAMRKIYEEHGSLRNSDTDDEKIKQIETARMSNGLMPKLEDKYYQGNQSKTEQSDGSGSHHLDRVDGEVYLLYDVSKSSSKPYESKQHSENFGYSFIMEGVQQEGLKDVGKRQSVVDRSTQVDDHQRGKDVDRVPKKEYDSKAVMVKDDDSIHYERKIESLSSTLQTLDQDYKKKLDALKKQYDANIKNMINEHNLGVSSMQTLHEDALNDIIKSHENEVETLRTMSIEAMKRVEKLERETLKQKLSEQISDISGDITILRQGRKQSPKNTDRIRQFRDGRLLTKTSIEAFNVKPKIRSGPCTCSIDVNVSDTIRNIFDQVDSDQSKVAEMAYMKYITGKIADGSIDALDAQELSFLHYTVCRKWKVKLSKEEALQKKIDSLELELMNKQRHAQKHIAELDRRVAEERLRLQEVREAVCQGGAPACQRGRGNVTHSPQRAAAAAATAAPNTGVEVICNCATGNPTCNLERRSAGDLLVVTNEGRPKRPKVETKPKVVCRPSTTPTPSRRDRRILSDELPTRLRRERATPTPPPRPARK